MLYLIFLALAVGYNWWKFSKERDAFLNSLIDAKSSTHREMILSHHFYVFIFESFLGFIVAHLITEGSFELGMLSLGSVYLVLLFWGFLLYILFVKYLERYLQFSLSDSFRKNLIKEIRVNFALVLLPILIYSLINLTFQGSVFEEWGSLWFIGLLFNILFVSVLTIVCTVIIMLKLIPNREITEPEYLEIINRRLSQINMPNIRLRWIETDVKNAFVVGLKLFRFSNQTLFLGRSLRTMLTPEEFDAVICHELSHVANRHVSKRLIELLKNFISVIVGSVVIVCVVLATCFFIWGEDGLLHSNFIALACIFACFCWFIFNYALLFDTIRSHEFEADAYAVMELGVDFDVWKSALDKLSQPDDLPDYLKLRTKRRSQGAISSKFSDYFSTHPKIDQRAAFLKQKMREKLVFNFYVSSTQKIRLLFGHLFQWKIALPSFSFFLVLLIWFSVRIKSGQDLISWIQNSSTADIMDHPELVSQINTSPTFFGPKLIFYIIKKEDPALIDYFLLKGADKGKTLLYLAELHDFNLFQKYYDQFGTQLTEDEYFLILRKTAQTDFVQGYRFLVNAQRFESLDSKYKENVSQLIELKRRPASVEKK